MHPRRCLLERSFGRLFLHLKEAIASGKKKKKAIALERFSVVGVLYSFLHACFKCIMSIGKSLRWVFTFSHTLQQTTTWACKIVYVARSSASTAVDTDFLPAFRIVSQRYLLYMLDCI